METILVEDWKLRNVLCTLNDYKEGNLKKRNQQIQNM